MTIFQGSWSIVSEYKMKLIPILGTIILSGGMVFSIPVPGVAQSDVAGSRGLLIEPQVHISGESGLFRKIDYIQRARETLDLGYFIYEEDYSSSYLSQEIVRRGAMGTRVRLLVDYLTTVKQAKFLQYMAAQTNVSVKVFRPPTPDFLIFLNADLGVQSPIRFVESFAVQDHEGMKQSLLGSDFSGTPELVEELSRIVGAPSSVAASERMRGAGVAVEFFSFIRRILSGDITTGGGSVLQKVARFREHLHAFLQRLHHKILVAQTEKGLEFIVGGRNISDEYHVTSGHELLRGRSYPFVDLEISGLYLREQGLGIRERFDHLWDSPSSVEVEPLLDTHEIESITTELNRKAEIFVSHAQGLQNASNRGTFQPTLRSPLKIEYIENLPARTLDDVSEKYINKKWDNLFAGARSSVTAIVAYFFLYKAWLSRLEEILNRRNPVKVDIYTNSPESTDMNMLNMGVYSNLQSWRGSMGLGQEFFNVYEMQSTIGNGSLHVKSIVVDRSKVGIGSCNGDPRSYYLDTQNMVFFENSEIAEVVLDAYLRSFDRYTGSGKLVWEKLTTERAQSSLRKYEIEEFGPAMNLIQWPDILKQL